MMNSIMSYIYTLVFFAIFIAVLEMILPKGNSKKYVRLVSGIILTYIVISPIVSILSSVSGVKDNITDGIETLNTSYSSNKKIIGQEQYILNLFEKGVEKDIKNRVEDCGYVIDNVEIKYNLNNDNEITDITYVSFNVIDRIEGKTNDSDIAVEKVSVDVNINKEDKKTQTSIELSTQEKKKIKESICNVYQIDLDNVYII